MKDRDLVSKFKKLPKKSKNVCLLLGEWTNILAWDPIEKFSYKIGEKENNFEKWVNKNTKKGRKLVGYISYDYGYQLYNIKNKAKDDLQLPDIYFLAFDKWFESNKPKPIKETERKKHKSKNFKATMTKSEYKKAYEKIKHHIKEGDIYQINLTHRLEAKTSLPSKELFLKIAESNPVEHLAYIEGDGFEILSASPERFIKIKNKKIETKPIKGTRPRGANRQEDQKLKKELIKSKKEAAELNMITDLLRNDIGKISKPGSVRVEGHRLISKCPTIWHTYSKITGKLDKFSSIEALISMLPGGSITGCPKKRAIEIIDQIEPTTRSIYTGVIGQIEPNKDLDFNIAIRTVIKKNDKLFLQVGGGIVLDSEKEAEFEETLHKAASFMKILE